jgi:hypothetical protein
MNFYVSEFLSFEIRPKKLNAVRPATGPHRSWILVPLFPSLQDKPAMPICRAAGRRFDPSALPEEATAFAEADRALPSHPAIRRSRSANRNTVPVVTSDPILLIEQKRGGGRNARATSPRLRAFPDIPRRIHPRENAGCRWLCHKSSGRLKNSHVSLNPLSVRLLRAAT